MINKARLKLTFWYLLIIMAISFAFSAFIYKSIDSELKRRFVAIERRMEEEKLFGRGHMGPGPYFQADIRTAEKNLLAVLLYANGVILVLSGGLGYFLAGISLRPVSEAFEEQKRFVADASHELKTPLTSLQTAIEVALRDKRLSLKEAKKILKENLKDIQNLKSLTNNLLTLARSQQVNHLAFVKLDLRKIALRVHKQFVIMAKNKKIVLSKSLKLTQLKGQEEMLEKLISILVDNAIKFTNRNGKVSLSTYSKGRCVYLVVKDNGIGIEKKDLPFIFDRFYRADASRSKSSHDGFGLGLSLAKKIVDIHKGEIIVKSSPGKGSTFKVKLPKNS